MRFLWCWRQPGEQEAVPHGPDDGVVRVDHPSAGENEAHLAVPVQCSAAIAADMAGPAAIIEPTFGAGGVLLLGRAGEQPRGYYGRGLPPRAADSRSN